MIFATVYSSSFLSFIFFSRNLYVKKKFYLKNTRWSFDDIFSGIFFFFLSSLHLSFTYRFYKIVKGRKKKRKINQSRDYSIYIYGKFIYIRIESKRNRGWNRIRGPARETWRVSIDSYWKVYFNREER